jgi:hypothetical protein
VLREGVYADIVRCANSLRVFIWSCIVQPFEV